jgi:hypothetical protein
MTKRSFPTWDETPQPGATDVLDRQARHHDISVDGVVHLTGPKE